MTIQAKDPEENSLTCYTAIHTELQLPATREFELDYVISNYKNPY